MDHTNLTPTPIGLETLDRIAWDLEKFDAQTAQPGYIALLANIMLNMAHSLANISGSLGSIDASIDSLNSCAIDANLDAKEFSRNLVEITEALQLFSECISNWEDPAIRTRQV